MDYNIRTFTCESHGSHRDNILSTVYFEVVCLTLLPRPSSGKNEHLGFVRDVTGKFFSFFNYIVIKSDASAMSSFFLEKRM